MQVLIVDDAPLNLQFYAKLLRQIPGLACTAFESSNAALRWAESNDPDLVLVDYNMPAPNGQEFIELFRAQPGNAMTPIVMITGSRDHEVRRRALETGATDFLTKPADPVEFIARVRNLLALREGQQKLASRAAWLADEVRRATEELVEREREAIFQLVRIAEFRDNETASHIVRIGHLAALVAKALDRPAAEVELLQLAAPMHDIGKVATPDRILLKPGKLTPEEWITMRQHTTAGYDVLKDSRSAMLRLGAEIALTHHEKYDGSGYPYGLRGDAIPLSGRITALVDVFDALTSDRPYKKAWSVTDALDQLNKDRASHFDPEIVDAFFTVVPEARAIKARYADVDVA